MKLRHLVFVYGTLRKGNNTRGLDHWPGARFVTADTTAADEFDMIDMGSFPAVVPGGVSKISGEVWEVSDQTFEWLDYVESYPSFYLRQLIKTQAGHTAWMYYLPNAEDYEHSMIAPVNNILTWE